MNENVEQALNALEELNEDTTVPKNVKQKLIKLISDLKRKETTHLELSKALHELEEISEDMYLPSYIRTQLFNVTSLLEGA